MKKMLDEISKEIAKFLKSNGGMQNSYLTFMKGSFTANGTIQIDWQTPKSDFLTIKEMRNRSNKFGSKIQDILNKHKYYDVVRIRARHYEHGCHSMELVTEQTQSISLNE
jgi:hypothetical protein